MLSPTDYEALHEIFRRCLSVRTTARWGRVFLRKRVMLGPLMQYLGNVHARISRGSSVTDLAS